FTTKTMLSEQACQRTLDVDQNSGLDYNAPHGVERGAERIGARRPPLVREEEWVPASEGGSPAAGARPTVRDAADEDVAAQPRRRPRASALRQVPGAVPSR